MITKNSRETTTKSVKKPTNVSVKFLYTLLNEKQRKTNIPFAYIQKINAIHVHVIDMHTPQHTQHTHNNNTHDLY